MSGECVCVSEANVVEVKEHIFLVKLISLSDKSLNLLFSCWQLFCFLFLYVIWIHVSVLVRSN